MTKNYASKWIKIGITIQDRRKIYDSLRLKAKSILENKHKKEYLNILNKLLKKEYTKLKNGR
jgi:hypothetical protein